MKILQVILTLSAGGAEGFGTHLSIALRNAGAEVKVFLLAGVRGERGNMLHERLRQAGIEVVGLQHRKKKNIFTNARHFNRLRSLIATWRPHIVQAMQPVAALACAASRPLTSKNGTRYVQRLVSTKSVSYRSRIKSRFLDRSFEQTIACSPSVAAAYKDLMKDSLRTKLVTIPNGGLLLDSVPTSDEKQKMRRKLQLPRDAFVVSHVGRMFGVGGRTGNDPKAHDVLLRAFARAFGNNRDSYLLLVGDGNLRPALEEMAGDLGIDDRVRFSGFLPEPWPALIAADVFCFPSRHEGLPNVLPEAASCGLPVVASNIPEIRYVYSGDAWELEAADDAAAFAAAMQTMRKNIGDYARAAKLIAPQFRERFSMETCAKKYLQAYEVLVGPNSE